MDLDRAFVSSVLRDGRDAVRQAQDRGVVPGWLEGDGAKAWAFVIEYLKTYPDVPTAEMLEGKANIALGEPPTGPSQFFVDEVVNRHLHKEITAKLKAVIAPLEQRDPQAAYQSYEQGLRELRLMALSRSKTVALWDQSDAFLTLYDKLKAGFTGIRTPWPSINESTLGFWPEDFVLFVARLGIGKTWAMVLLALHAWHVEKKKVLFATTEMSYEKILQRAVAAHFKLPYEDLRKGRLDSVLEHKMREGVAQLKGDPGIRIVGGEFDFRIESLEAALEESEPDILFLDGAYLLRVDGANRTERAANSYDELKRIAKRQHIPVVASTQFNREVKSNQVSASSVNADKIALSDVAGWNADLIYGLVRTEDMKKDGRMIMLPLKFREGVGDEIETWWDFRNMNFSEIPAPGKGPQTAAVPKTKGEDPFDTGIGNLF
jgi:replicative DNA helicase